MPRTAHLDGDAHDADVRTEHRGRALVVTFDRPDRLNAFTPAMHDAMRDAFARAERDASIRGVVLTGAGRGFCAGADAGALDAMAESGDGMPVGSSVGQVDRAGYGVHPAFDRPFASLLGLSVPVVAAVNGPAVGLGFVLACYADVRFATADAVLSSGFGPLAMPAEYGLSWLLPRLVGGARATELLLSSRKLRGDEAAAMGLVHRVCEPEDLVDEAVAWLQDVGDRCDPGAVATTKRQLHVDWMRDLGASFDEAVALADEASRSPQFREGVRALRERRLPDFG